MSTYVFAYHGGSMPESEEAAQQVMADWMAWLQGLGEDVLDGGAPVGLAITLHPDGQVVRDGGANPLSGYSLVRAESEEDAVAKARGCPHLRDGGTIEIAEAVEM